MKNKIIYLKEDLTPEVKFSKSIAIDCEMTGLSPIRDRLCLIQMTDGQGTIYIIKINPPYNCPNLKKILNDSKSEKIFHFARSDMAVIKKDLNIDLKNVFCTKIASKLCRTYTDRHSLKTLVKEFFDIDLNKEEQSSDWASDDLTDKQIEYAANDVLYLHRIKDILTEKLKREQRFEIALSCFEFLPHRVWLDHHGWYGEDIFEH